MRGMKNLARKERRMMPAMVSAKHGMMIRRAANHNVHVITPHGKIQAGRKGRKG